MSGTTVRRKPALEPRWDKGFQAQGFEMTSPRKGTETAFQRFPRIAASVENGLK